MSNKNKATNKTYGKIAESTSLLTNAKIGAYTKYGEPILIKNDAAGTPVVEFNNNTFILPWTDIIKLAEEAGLFEYDENDQGEQDNG